VGEFIEIEKCKENIAPRVVEWGESPNTGCRDALDFRKRAILRVEKSQNVIFLVGGFA
jgi:hypothetical protein